MTPEQQRLAKLHGTPEEFERACERAVDGLMITPLECYEAVQKYRREWADAGESK